MGSCSRYLGSNGERAERVGIRSSSYWSKLLSDDEPINVIVGDYFIFGDRGPDGMVRRLIRDFSINSDGELREHTVMHPEVADQYESLDLRYLPVSVAYALGEAMPLIAEKKKRIHIMLASEFRGSTLKSGHIIYVGFLSGMGMIEDLAFADSRYAAGDSYDESWIRVMGGLT